MNTFYEVRFTYYQYNTGRGDNGTYPLKEKFNTLDEAKARVAHIVTNYCNSKWLDENYHICGYVTKVDGIYKITEEPVEPKGMFVEGAGRIATSVQLSPAECEAIYHLIEVEVFNWDDDVENDITDPLVSACVKIFSLAKKFEFIPADLEQYIPRPFDNRGN